MAVDIYERFRRTIVLMSWDTMYLDKMASIRDRSKVKTFALTRSTNRGNSNDGMKMRETQEVLKRERRHRPTKYIIHTKDQSLALVTAIWAMIDSAIQLDIMT